MGSRRVDDEAAERPGSAIRRLKPKTKMNTETIKQPSSVNEAKSEAGLAASGGSVMFRIIEECHKCGTQIDSTQKEAADWYWPVYIRRPDSWLQTALCPKCAPKFSLRRALMRANNRWPRWLHRLFANANGYFWLPCPVCGKLFGGHEHGGDLDLGNGRGQMTCGCNRAQSQNKQITKT